VSIEFFTVDAALLQELGERLIGRPHIALAEIVKNSYDADAFLCEVTIEDDHIVVADNGHGMDLDAFRDFYLRLGTQNKRRSEVSPEFGRRLTGAKGVGRLAAQFLGSQLTVETARKNARGAAVRAKIDWSQIRSGEDLSDFPVEVNQISRETLDPFPARRTYGTRIIISGMRTALGPDEIEGLGREVWSLRSPFERIAQRGREPDPRDFTINLNAGIEDAEELFDEVLNDLTEYVWRAKISGRVTNGRKTDRGEITIEFTEGYPPGTSARVYKDEISLSSLKWGEGSEAFSALADEALLDDVDFTIYVYKLEQKQRANVPLEELKDYLARFGSVSIYDAGFRLPYYGIDNDWLRNGAEQAQRKSISQLLPSKWNIEGRYMLDLPEPRRLFGYVEISTNHEAAAARRRRARSGEWLEVQSGRDRLIDNLAHRQLQAFVRYSLDLYANRYRARLIKSREDARDTEPAERKFSRFRKTLEENKDVIPRAVYSTLEVEAEDAEKAAAAIEDLSDARIVALAPLAAAGMTALGMTHELAREARLLDRTRRRLTKLARDHDLPELKALAGELAASLVRLRSLQSLFSPLLSQEDREGDDRLRVKAVVEQVVRAMAPLTPGLEIDIEIDENLRFPPGPLAAWSAVLQNLISNSWNASLATADARVAIAGYSQGSWEGISISDRGVGVNLEDSERLFDAFERDLVISPEHVSVAIGGQGMGLAIVRMLCEKYGVTPEFVEPEEGYATTLDLSWKA
jgi:signal transduction histidine kinase